MMPPELKFILEMGATTTVVGFMFGFICYPRRVPFDVVVAATIMIYIALALR